jgi:hypothetical protein
MESTVLPMHPIQAVKNETLFSQKRGAHFERKPGPRVRDKLFYSEHLKSGRKNIVLVRGSS